MHPHARTWASVAYKIKVSFMGYETPCFYFSFVSIYTYDDWSRPAIRATARFLQIVTVSYPPYFSACINNCLPNLEIYCLVHAQNCICDLWPPKRWLTCMPIVLGWELKTKELSKIRNKLVFVYCASSECINHKGSVVHYSHRNDLIINYSPTHV